jgi:hypothetical protein
VLDVVGHRFGTAAGSTIGQSTMPVESILAGEGAGLGGLLRLHLIFRFWLLLAAQISFSQGV